MMQYLRGTHIQGGSNCVSLLSLIGQTGQPISCSFVGYWQKGDQHVSTPPLHFRHNDIATEIILSDVYVLGKYW